MWSISGILSVVENLKIILYLIANELIICKCRHKKQDNKNTNNKPTAEMKLHKQWGNIYEIILFEGFVDHSGRSITQV